MNQQIDQKALENFYISIHAGIASILAEIEGQFNNLPVPDNVTWGAVGDLNNVLISLKAILDDLNQINEVKK